jgi:phage protein D
VKAQICMLVATLTASTVAMACGVCIEDRVAATYDYAVVTKAAAERKVMVFAAVDGQGTAKALAANAQRAAGKVAGVDRASVRSAAEPAAALSFALDPRAQTPEAALGAIAQYSAQKDMRLTLLRVVP